MMISSRFGKFLALLNNGQSTTSRPLLINTPAKQARGTLFASGPKPKTTMSKTTEWVAPAMGVRPPVLTFTTVRMVAPAPAEPPKRPATELPMPWPISSRLLSWKLDVNESDTKDVRSESIAPRTAKEHEDEKTRRAISASK